jgi:Pectate lyase superfamily protein
MSQKSHWLNNRLPIIPILSKISFVTARKRMKPSFPRSWCIAVFAAAMVCAPIAAHAMGDEEFVGPFASWANVKTTYGAAGNGATDDTAAIQKALNSLSPTNPTIYFPPGTYLVTQTLTLTAQEDVNVIGADPSTTTIEWGGSSGGTMLHLNGVAYSRFDRLTFNGKGNAAVTVDQSWDGSTGYFDTGNEYADDVFENAGAGFRCGNLGYGCAETSMLRDQFLSDSIAGVAMENFNALDMFIWYSLFQNDAEGVSNQPGAGNFHVFNSIFEGSTTADITIGNTGGFNFRNNYSIGSNQFIGPSIGTSNPATITVEGNTILDTANPRSIAVGNLGPVVLIDNTIRSLASVITGPVVAVANWNPSDLFSMGNTFTVSSPTYANGHYHSVGDQVVARSTVNPSPPTLPGTPPNNNRQIFEVTPGSTAAQIQAAISSAAAAITDKPVVHIQPGTYSVNKTLVVPAGSDIQIIGDGHNSQLVWTGPGAGPVMQLQGPNKATLRDFSVNGNNYSGNGIEVQDADQAGSSIFMEQPNLSSSYTNLFVDGLDYTNVQLHDFYHEYDSTAGATSVDVTGGPDASQGHWQGGVTNIFAGASAGNYISYLVSNGAHFSVEDIWYDAGAGGDLVANVTGASTFSYAGSMLYFPNTSTQIALNNFTGTAALVNLNMNGNVSISGSGSNARVLGLGLVGPSTTFFSHTLATTEFLNGETTANPPSGSATSELPEQGTANASFLTTTLNQLRTQQPTLLAPLASGVTDVRFYRVFVNNAITGIHLDNDAASAGNGACGSANGVAVSSAPISSLCSAGTASAVSGSGPWSWSCTGGNGGTTASCTAPILPAAVNGSCGTSNGADLTSVPTTGLCSAGAASAVSGSGPWNWSCAGSNGGSAASCAAQLEINGSCGSANGVAMSAKPTKNLCSTGAASAVNGTFPWDWTCAGSNGGTTASCSTIR